MITIIGDIKPIRKIKYPCPDDGIHRVGSDGCLRGAHGAYIGDAFVPYGLNGFYWQIDYKTGIKVYYSIVHKKRSKNHIVSKIFQKAQKLWEKTNINPKPISVETVSLSCYSGELAGIVTEHCHYPPFAWQKYALGVPYDWDCVGKTEHPEHNPEGFLRFRKYALSVVKRFGLTSKAKLGDVVYDITSRSWKLVDVD